MVGQHYDLVLVQTVQYLHDGIGSTRSWKAAVPMLHNLVRIHIVLCMMRPCKPL